MDDTGNRRLDTAVDLIDFVDDLQASGRYSFTPAEARSVLCKSGVALDNSLLRLKKRRRLVSPRRGFHVIVPTEYRSAGAPPPSWFIDDLMRFLRQPYYVGLLTAAALHGASHQQPMVFQVVTDRPTRQALAGRARVEFRMSRSVEDAPVAVTQTETGFMRVSTPEATAIDLVRFAPACGGWSNVATVLAELGEQIDPEKLCLLAAAAKTPEVQRLGFLLDRAGQSRLADALLRVLSAKRYRPVLLAPDVPRGEQLTAAPWRVIANQDVEPEL